MRIEKDIYGNQVTVYDNKETAKFIKAALAEAFPAYPMKVYAYDGIVEIQWWDGPTEKEVAKAIAPFRAGNDDSDLMTDYHGYKSMTHWVNGKAVRYSVCHYYGDGYPTMKRNLTGNFLKRVGKTMGYDNVPVAQEEVNGKHSYGARVWAEWVERKEYPHFDAMQQTIHSKARNISEQEIDTIERGKNKLAKANTQYDAQKIADKLDKLADGMEKAIQQKLNPGSANQNVTARRTRIIMGMQADGMRMKKTQDILRMLAEGHRDGSLPQSLRLVNTRTLVEDLLSYPHWSEKSSWIAAGATGAYEWSIMREDLKKLEETAKERQKELRRQQELRNEERRVAQLNIEGFFPTPANIIEMMLEKADVQSGHSVLEPSAGRGDIASKIRECHPDASLKTVEQNYTLAKILSGKGFDNHHGDFLAYQGEFDRILMNPPFERFQDIDHLRHAFSLLKEGGRVVSIMGASSFFRTDKKASEFREWADNLSAEYEKLPEGSFLASDRPTGVATYIITICK